jgi:outer membrane biosynthesis protein TonB
MKKMLCGVMVMVAIMLFGCSKPSPEEAAEEYVKKQFASDFGAKLHTSNLAYKIVKEDEHNATVNVSGNIFYEEDIQLVMDGGNWVLRSEAAQREAVAAEAEAEAETAAAVEPEPKPEPEPEPEPEAEAKAKTEAEAETAAAVGQ